MGKTRLEKMRKMKIEICSREEIEERINKNELNAEYAVISFCDDIKVEYPLPDKDKKVFYIENVPDISYPDLKEYGYTKESFFPSVKKLAEFIRSAYNDNLNFICQCECGESRSAAVAAAIKEFYFYDGLPVFADNKYCPNQLVFDKVYEELLLSVDTYAETEGFVPSKDDFNGLVFLLREPNSEEQQEFYFKDCLRNNNLKNRNKFENYKTYVSEEMQLNQCAYFNLRYDGGESERSKIYYRILDSEEYFKKRFENIIKYCKTSSYNNILYLFTCDDIFQKMSEYGIIPKDPENDFGVRHKRKGKIYQKECCTFCYEGTTIKVFEIYHPSCAFSIESAE